MFQILLDHSRQKQVSYLLGKLPGIGGAAGKLLATDSWKPILFVGGLSTGGR